MLLLKVAVLDTFNVDKKFVSPQNVAVVPTIKFFAIAAPPSTSNALTFPVDEVT